MALKLYYNIKDKLNACIKMITVSIGRELFNPDKSPPLCM